MTETRAEKIAQDSAYLNKLEELESALVLEQLHPASRATLLHYMATMDSWLNLSPLGARHQLGDYLCIERAMHYVRMASLGEDDVVLILRGAKKGE